MKTPFALSGAVLAAAVIVVAVLQFTPPKNEAAQTTTTLPLVVMPNAAVPPAAPGVPRTADPLKPGRASCTLAPGEQLAFRLVSTTTGPLSIPGSPTTNVDASITGHLGLKGVGPSQNGTIVVAQLTELESNAPGVGAASLGAPFLVELSPDCRLVRFARGKSVDRDSARNQQALLWSGAFTLTPGEVVMHDGVGTFLAKFSRTGTRLERHQASYQSMWQANARDVPANGLLVVELGAGPWFESLQLRQSVTLTEGNSQLQLELKRVEATPPLALVVRDEDFIWEDLLPVVRVGRTHAERPFNGYDLARREKVKDLTEDQAVEQFIRRTAGNAGLQDTWPELSAWFEVHPEGIERVLQRLRDRKLPAVSIAPLYTAIGKARVPEARDALLKIRRDAVEPPMDRVRATFNLLDREDVGVPLAEELAVEGVVMGKLDKKENFLRGEALLALGMMAGLRAQPELDTVARRTLSEVLTHAEPDSQVAHSAFKALGNLGDPQLLPLIQPGTEAQNIFTRIAAAHAFRRMPPAQSEAVALEWLRRETHPFVKRQLYITIRRQYFDAQVPVSEAMTRQAMADLAITEAPIDRKTIIRFLSMSALKAQPEFRTFLVAQARKERDTGILNVFTDLLEPEEVSEALR